jgi:lysophospholipase L1-like esterase
MKPLIQKILACASLMLAGLSAAQAQIVNFNGTDPASQFNQTNGGTYGYGYWQNNSGILDQAGPAAGGSANAYTASPTYQYNTPVNTSGVQAFTISGMIKGDFASSGSGVTALGLGFMQDPWSDFRGVTSYVALKLIGNGTNLTWHTSLWGGDYNQGGGVTLDPANWYRVSATFTKSATAGLWNWSASISNYGTTGTILVSSISSTSGSFTHSNTYNASSLYGAINITATSLTFNSTRLDDFTIAAGAATPVAPANLVATAGDAQVGLSWSASSGATGYIIKRSTTTGTGYTIVGSASGTTFTDTGLTNGTPYYYLVSAVSAAESPNSTEASATPVAAAPAAKIVRIDFGPNDATNGNSTTSPDANGRYWNNLVSGNVVSNGLSISNLVTIANAPTTFGVSVSSTGWRSNGILNGGLLAPSASQLGELAIPTATQDYFYLDGAGTSATLNITGLDPTKFYNLRMFGTRDNTETRRSTYTATGGNGAFSTTLQTSGNNIGSDGAYDGNDNNIATINGVQPNASSQIQFQLTVTTSGFGYLGLMEITEVPAPVVVSKTIRIDFGPNDVTNGNSTTSPDTNGRYWNNMVSGNVVSNGLSIANLVTTANAATTVGLSVSSTGWRSNGILNGGLLAPSASLLGELAIPTATQDYFYLDGAGTSATLNITGLDPTKFYNLRMFGTRDNTETRRSTYTATGGNGSFSTTLQTSGNNIGSDGAYDGNDNNIATINGVQPNASSQIQFQLTVATSGFGYLGLMEITEVPAPTVVTKTMRVDFGPSDVTNGNPTTSPDANGRYWNNMVSGNIVSNGLVISNLVTTANAATTVGVNISSTGWKSNGILNGGLLAPSSSLLGELAIATATQDYFYIDGPAATLTITGLDPAKYYDLRMFGSRDNTETRTSNYTITGGNGVFSTTLQTSGNNIGSNGTYDGNDTKIASINGVKANSSAQIQIQLSAAASIYAYLGLLEITETDTPTPNPPPVAITDGVNRWAAQDLLDPIAPGSVLFVGSSSVRRWESLTRDFSDYRITQRGFGGSQFSDLNPLLNKIVVPYQPSAIVVWEGTNDIRIGGKSAATVFADFQTFVSSVRAQIPGVPICFLGITPCPSFFYNLAQDQTRRDTNTLIRNYCAANPSLNLHFFDTSTFFEALHDAGTPQATAQWNSYFVDDTHLNRAGYQVWLSIVRPALAAVIAPNKTFTANPNTLVAGEKLFFDFGPSDATNGDETNQIDTNGNKWNNWHPTNGGGTINSGEHLRNLVRSTGTGTGIRMTITGGFLCNGKTASGGLYSPSPALLGDLAVESATEDFWYSTADDVNNATSDDVPGGFMLEGLNPALTYEFRFLGSRSTTETHLTEFKVYGANQAAVILQTSGTGIGSGGGNANDDELAVISGIRPDAFGQAFIDLTLLQGSQTHLNAMKISASVSLTAYQTWRSSYFGSQDLANPALEASLWGDLADPDFDGRSNLLEYATGTLPLTADAGTITTLGQSVTNKLTLTFTRIADPTLTYDVRGSNDLSTFLSGPPIFTSSGANNITGPVTAEDTETIGSQPRRLLRLEVSH